MTEKEELDLIKRLLGSDIIEKAIKAGYEAAADLCAKSRAAIIHGEYLDVLPATEDQINGGHPGNGYAAAISALPTDSARKHLDDFILVAFNKEAQDHRDIQAEPSRGEDEHTYDRGYVWGYRHGLRDAAKNNEPIPVDIVERVARAWASIDGVSELYDKDDGSDPELGYRDGYISEAHELLHRAGLIT